MLRLLLIFALFVSCVHQEPVQSTEYTVQRGDSLAKIAKRYDITVEELREWNGIEGNLIKPGQTLRIHGRSTVSTGQQPRKRRRSKAKAPDKPKLVMPSAKRCLKGPSIDSVEADEGFATSQGLGLEAIRQSMNVFLPNTLRCAEGLNPPSGVLLVEITVACTGRGLISTR